MTIINDLSESLFNQIECWEGKENRNNNKNVAKALEQRRRQQQQQQQQYANHHHNKRSMMMDNSSSSSSDQGTSMIRIRDRYHEEDGQTWDQFNEEQNASIILPTINFIMKGLDDSSSQRKHQRKHAIGNTKFGMISHRKGLSC